MKAEMIHNKSGQINIVFHEPSRRSSGELKPIKNDPFIHIDEQFSAFVGMEELKQTIKEIYATIVINSKRQQFGLHCSNQVLHMLFKGNPGTGKTTVARKLAQIFFEMNILSKGHFIEAERADLVGEYIGQTAQKTRSIIDKAMGGILFIDEAYSLARGGEKDFGKEAIDTLVKHMEDHHNDFILILAGYPYEMERFLVQNPGLKSRFPFILDFNDYEIHQLMEIAQRMAAEREYELTTGAILKIKSHIMEKRSERNFSNARYVRNIIEHAIRMQAVRLLRENNYTLGDLTKIYASDLQLSKLDSKKLT
ncbi:AAA family ATPase [Virgibacillus sp. W0181]|uniref:AAA family ATPase n=1 Tax=Virgibacillus sp. W0181 TaxID=3391581 RepID=UPI003F452980